MSVLSDWKNSLITQEVFAEIRTRIEDLKEDLAFSAGVDPRADAYKCGAIAAMKDILDIKLDEEPHDD